MTRSPYDGLPGRAFWRSAVAERAPLATGDIFTPKFPISRTDRIMTAGSCFAQHIGRHLRTAGMAVLDAEPLSTPFVSDETAQRFGYRLYSARYGNIYSIAQFRQLLLSANDAFQPTDPVWAKGQRWVDALRPSVEPEGLHSPDEVLEHRRFHLGRVADLLEMVDVVVFTFGLTEAWLSTGDGTVFPTAPGTLAGEFDPTRYHFHNFSYEEVLADFLAVRAIVRERRPDVRFLVTVSPVPLTATASGQHVEVATIHSKSILRAVCGALVSRYDDVDYFPSFEIITSQRAHSAYYEANLRSVSAIGVAAAMNCFAAAHGISVQRPTADLATADAAAELVCEDLLLEAFAT